MRVQELILGQYGIIVRDLKVDGNVTCCSSSAMSRNLVEFVDFL